MHITVDRALEKLLGQFARMDDHFLQRRQKAGIELKRIPQIFLDETPERLIQIRSLLAAIGTIRPVKRRTAVFADLSGIFLMFSFMLFDFHLAKLGFFVFL